MLSEICWYVAVHLVLLSHRAESAVRLPTENHWCHCRWSCLCLWPFSSWLLAAAQYLTAQTSCSDLMPSLLKSALLSPTTFEFQIGKLRKPQDADLYFKSYQHISPSSAHLYVSSVAHVLELCLLFVIMCFSLPKTHLWTIHYVDMINVRVISFLCMQNVPGIWF